MFNENLRYIRKSRNMTQKEVAEELRLNCVTYNRYETGERAPKLEIIIKLADFFNVTTDQLLGRKNILMGK